jgi:hypothetical protein
MDPHADDPAADIAWMRRLAEEGGQAPMTGAPILFFAGALYAGASLFHWAIVTGLVPVDPASIWMGWVAATLLFFVALVVFVPRVRKDSGVVTAANRASGIAWSAMGWGIFALFLSLAIVGYRMGETFAEGLFGLIPSIILVFYGIGWTISAVVHKARPLWFLSIGSYIAAPVLAVFSGSATQYLAYAAALILFMALPGVVLMRAAKRA